MSGVAIALLAGKPIGVISATWLMVRIGWGRLPPGVSWAGVCLIGLLAGIGFTMSIFIALLAFHDEHLLGAAKLGVIVGVASCGLRWSMLGPHCESNGPKQWRSSEHLTIQGLHHRSPI